MNSSIAPAVVAAFEALTPNLDSITTNASSQSLNAWCDQQVALAAAAGGAAMALPGAHMLALAADMGVLMNRMAVVSYGVGAILARDHRMMIERDDFALVLAIWSGDFSRASMLDGSAAVAAKSSAKIAIKVGGKAAVAPIATAVGQAAGILAGKKLGTKTAAKIGSKFVAKLATKGGAGWIPFVGAAVGAAINGYFVSEIAKAAREYYDAKRELLNKIEFDTKSDDPVDDNGPTVQTARRSLSACVGPWQQELAADLAIADNRPHPQDEAFNGEPDVWELVPHLKPDKSPR